MVYTGPVAGMRSLFRRFSWSGVRVVDVLVCTVGETFVTGAWTGLTVGAGRAAGAGARYTGAGRAAGEGARYTGAGAAFAGAGFGAGLGAGVGDGSAAQRVAETEQATTRVRQVLSMGGFLVYGRSPRMEIP